MHFLVEWLNNCFSSNSELQVLFSQIMKNYPACKELGIILFLENIEDVYISLRHKNSSDIPPGI